MSRAHSALALWRPGDISITKTGTGAAWASVHWQYLEDIAKITAHHITGLSLEKLVLPK